MVQWTDRNGGTWDVLFTHGLCQRVKAETGIDLYRAMETGATLGDILFGDFGRKLVEVLYVVHEPEIQARGVEPEAWADLFDGATIERATQAFMEGISDFFPRTRIGQAVRENLTKTLDQLDADVLKKLKLPNRAGSPAPSSTTPDAAA